MCDRMKKKKYVTKKNNKVGRASGSTFYALFFISTWFNDEFIG